MAFKIEPVINIAPLKHAPAEVQSGKLGKHIPLDMNRTRLTGYAFSGYLGCRTMYEACICQILQFGL
jgi:hypothetical protein